MSVPTRKQWTQLRDKAGGKAGMVKSVSIGTLLDDLDKAGAGTMGLKLKLARVKPLGALAKGLKTYRAALPATNAQLIKVVDDITKEVNGEIKDGQMMANPVQNVTSHLRDAIKNSAAIATSGDATAYSKLWSNDIRGAGTGFAALVKLDPGLKTLYDTHWKPLTLDEWGTSGAKVAGKLTDPAQVKAKVIAAAKHINKTAQLLMTELIKLNVTT